jgi:peptidoglycan/xylan/chitin deacetylase (PgdA/CDA1 family)
MRLMISPRVDPRANPEPATPLSAKRATQTHFVATYHYVRECNSDGVTGITPHEFREHLRLIQARYRVVTVEEFAAVHGAADGLALLTFDDALRDQFLAASILDEFGLPGVFFAPMRPYSDEPDRWCTQHLLHSLANELGWTELERRIAPHLAGLEIDQREVDRLYHYEVPTKRRLKYALAFALPAEQAATILREINGAVGLRAEDWYMTADQLRALEDAGHALGGHGFDHVPYNTLTPKAQAADMHRAVRTMNERFGTLARALAYPFGGHTAVTAALAASCGYTYCFDTTERVDAKYFRDEFARRARPTPATTPSAARREPQPS